MDPNWTDPNFSDYNYFKNYRFVKNKKITLTLGWDWMKINAQVVYFSNCCSLMIQRKWTQKRRKIFPEDICKMLLTNRRRNNWQIWNRSQCQLSLQSRQRAGYRYAFDINFSSVPISGVTSNIYRVPVEDSILYSTYVFIRLFRHFVDRLFDKWQRHVEDPINCTFTVLVCKSKPSNI